MSEKLWIRAQKTPNDFGTDLYIFSNNEYNKRSIVKDITFEKVDESTAVRKSLSMDDDALQVFMDDLWRCGIRPSKEVIGDSDKTDIKNHLEDMRKLVFRDIGYERLDK
jgi:hypothetical protein